MKILLSTCLLGLAFVLSSCGDSPEDVTEDLIEVFSDATDVIKGVNDGDDAEDAIEELKDLKGDLEEIAKKMKKIDEDSSDEEKREMEKEMEEKYGKEMTKVMGEFMGEVAKLPTSGTVGANDVAKAAKDLMSAMTEL